MNDKNYKELSSSYKTTAHFKDRLRERFNVFNNQLPWAQTFFNSQPRLLSEQGDIQKWSNGNITLVTNVKEKSYITAYSVSGNVKMNSDTYDQFEGLAEKLIAKNKRETVKKIAEIKKRLITKSTDISGSIDSIKKVNDDMFGILQKQEKFEHSISDLLESIIVYSEDTDENRFNSDW